MKTEADVKLEEGEVYEPEQITKLKNQKKIYELAQCEPDVLDYVQGNNIYSLKSNGDGMLKVIRCINLRREI